MKKKPAIIILVIVSTLTINMKLSAQVADTSHTKKNNYFFVSPLSLLDVINPAITIGYERKISKRFALQIEGGPILERSLFGYFFTGLGFGTRDAWWRNSGGKIRAELKYFPETTPKKTFKKYYAFEVFITQNKSNVTQLYEISDTTYDYSNKDVKFAWIGIYDDFYEIRRNRFGTNFKIGIQEVDKRNVTIDSSVGVGIAYQSAEESGRTNYNDKPYNGNQPFLKPGNRILPTLTIGIKIGFKK